MSIPILASVVAVIAPPPPPPPPPVVVEDCVTPVFTVDVAISVSFTEECE